MNKEKILDKEIKNMTQEEKLFIMLISLLEKVSERCTYGDLQDINDLLCEKVRNYYSLSEIYNIKVKLNKQEGTK